MLQGSCKFLKGVKKNNLEFKCSVFGQAACSQLVVQKGQTNIQLVFGKDVASGMAPTSACGIQDRNIQSI